MGFKTRYWTVGMSSSISSLCNQSKMIVTRVNISIILVLHMNLSLIVTLPSVHQLVCAHYPFPSLLLSLSLSLPPSLYLSIFPSLSFSLPLSIFPSLFFESITLPTTFSAFQCLYLSQSFTQVTYLFSGKTLVVCYHTQTFLL